MNIPLFNKLQQEGLLSASSLEKIHAQKGKQLFSLHWEIRTILYLGILLLTGGLGILVYKNIDSLSHQVVLLFIGLICGGSFFYCFKKKLPFSNGKVKAPNALFDYILLLGCLTFIIFIAYFQYQYNIFGNRYGLATFLPMTVLFFTAYYFDHLGILSLAITNLAAWLGISVTPLQVLEANDFNNNTIILTGVLLGIFLVTMGLVSLQKNIKAHFEFTYTNFGIHILFISLLAAMFQFSNIHLLIFLLLVAVAFYFYSRAKKEQSFYLLLVSTLYTYIGLCYVVIHALSYSLNSGMGSIYLGFIYFIASGIGLVLFLMRTNKKLKAS
ncbi:MAG: DUF2157 domain-containing protein [Ferruginibacter sp.]